MTSDLIVGFYLFIFSGDLAFLGKWHIKRGLNISQIISFISQENSICINALNSLEEWYWRIYLQGRIGETDIQNRLMNMGRGWGVWKNCILNNL